MKTLFRNATVVNADGSRVADVLVCGEKISAVSEKIVCPDAEEIDCSGLLLFPGAIDAHTHFDLDVAGTTTDPVQKAMELLPRGRRRPHPL